MSGSSSPGQEQEINRYHGQYQEKQPDADRDVTELFTGLLF
jgi:hypothetical protein